MLLFQRLDVLLWTAIEIIQKSIEIFSRIGLRRHRAKRRKKNTNEWKAKAVRGNRIRQMKNVPSKGPGGRRRESRRGETGERKWTMETSAYKKRLSSIRDAVRVPIFIQQDLTFFSLFYVYTQTHRHTNTRLNKTNFSFTQGFSAMSIRPTVCVLLFNTHCMSVLVWMQTEDSLHLNLNNVKSNRNKRKRREKENTHKQ